MRVERTVTEEPRWGVSVVKQYSIYTYGQTDRQVDRKTGRQTNGQTDRQSSICHTEFTYQIICYNKYYMRFFRLSKDFCTE
jgi:hypothetical protein